MNGTLLPSAADRRLLPDGRLAGPMPWVIAIMTFLTVLATGTGIGLQNAASSLGDALAGKLTVQIVAANPDLRERQVRAALSELGTLAMVEKAERVPDAQLREQLSPWLGSEGLDADLPVPALIDVTLSRADDAAMADIAAAIRQIAPAARVEAHAQWLGPLQALLSTLRWLALGLVVLMAAAMAAAVVLAARAALNTHKPTIDVMHLMGASDVQVARLFQRRAALDAGFGGLLGTVVGAGVMIGLGGQLARLDAALLDQGGLGWVGWAAIAVIPALVVALAVVTARTTVIRALGTML